METTAKKSRLPLVLLVAVLLVAAGVAAYFLWPRPLVTAQGYIASPTETAPYTGEEGAALGTYPRGTAITYVVEEEDEDYPGMVRLVLGEKEFAYIAKEHLTDDVAKAVTTEAVYATTATTLVDEAGSAPLAQLLKGDELQVTGYDGLTAEGAVVRYRIRTEGGTEGYVPSRYVSLEQETAAKLHDEELQAFHAARGDDWGGGDAGELDYEPRPKVSIEGNTMPAEVKALYLNSEFVPLVDTYLDIASGTGINAFVIDIQDGEAVAYQSPTMEKYSPTAYAESRNTLADYRAAVKKIQDAGYYTIGRITAFNDPYYATDHPEHLIARTSDGQPQKIVGMYWPSVFQRGVWQYKVDLAIEAIETMGFNEIQFDYVRFPDGTWDFSDGYLDYRNDYGESKAQAVQRFLMYAADRIHDAGAYISADVFGECSSSYVCAYGQYWPAITNVVDVISAMPYPDHYAASGSYLPWEHPYETLYGFGESAAQRQTEAPTPGAVRTWIQAYSAIREPYTYYGPNEVAAQIQALRDTGNTGGYMTWHGASDTDKYYTLRPAFD